VAGGLVVAGRRKRFLKLVFLNVREKLPFRRSGAGET